MYRRDTAGTMHGTISMNDTVRQSWKESADQRVADLRPVIGGGRVDPSATGSFSVVNPATGQKLYDVASCGSVDVDRAVSAARRAFDDGRWRAPGPMGRRSMLLRFAELIERHGAQGFFDCYWRACCTPRAECLAAATHRPS